MRACIWCALLGTVIIFTVAKSTNQSTVQHSNGIKIAPRRVNKAKSSQSASKWSSAGPRKTLNAKGRSKKRRGHIIKCCGKDSCRQPSNNGGGKNRSRNRGSTLPTDQKPSIDVSKDSEGKGAPPPAVAKGEGGSGGAAPAGGGGKDAAEEEGSAAPAGGDAAPAEGGAAPPKGGAAPPGDEAAPAEGGSAPAEGGAAPAEGGAAPAEGGAAPAEGGAAPSDAGTAPEKGGEAPADGGAAPVEGGAAPPKGADAQPADGGAAPAGSQTVAAGGGGAAAPAVTEPPPAGGGQTTAGAVSTAAPAAGEQTTTAQAAAAATTAAAAVDATTIAAAGGGGATTTAAPTTAAGGAAAVTTTAPAAGGGATTPAPTTVAGAAPAEATTTPAGATTTTVVTTTPKPCAATCSLTCVKNNTLFTSNKLNDPESYGIWVTKCGKTYLFGTELLNWQDTNARCCSIGMKPLTIDTKEQQTCLGGLVKGAWFGNLNYWTSGSRAGCPAGSAFTWCSNSAAVPNTIEWDQGQPDNAGGQQTCAHLRMNLKVGSATLTDRNCTSTYPLACEDTTVRTYECINPTCNSACSKDMTLFSAPPDSKLNNHASYGSWIEVKGRLYLFSTATATWQEASNTCCKLGMSLLSLETSTESTNLYGKATQRSTYWTSGTDTGCDDYFGWCGSGKSFIDADISWATGMPRGAAAGYHCVSATLGASKITLADETCTKTLPYICEVRSTQQYKPGKAIMEECIQQLGLTNTETSAISATSVSATMPAKTKCYLKCVGEQLGIFYDGAIVEPAILSLMEQVILANEVDLQDHYEYFEECVGEEDPNSNPCQTAYLIYKCAMEYVEFPTFIAALDANTTAELSPLPCAPTCL